jgi:hypothetical protein
MGPATERVYREALESDEHQALLDEVSYRGARRGLSKRDTAILLAEEWEEFTLENFPDDAVHVDFAACAVRFINEHWIEGESSAFETAMQTTVGIGVGLFRLAFSAVVFLFVMGALAVGCLMLLS